MGITCLQSVSETLSRQTFFLRAVFVSIYNVCKTYDVRGIYWAVKGMKCMGICWLLLGNQDFKDPYLKAKVVEEVMGWLGWAGPQ